MKKVAFRERATQVMQDALSLVCCVIILYWLSFGWYLPDIYAISMLVFMYLQMFAPLLEPGEARDGFILLRDPAGYFRKFALRIGMFMSNIPEINRQLGTII